MSLHYLLRYINGNVRCKHLHLQNVDTEEYFSIWETMLITQRDIKNWCAYSVARHWLRKAVSTSTWEWMQASSRSSIRTVEKSSLRNVPYRDISACTVATSPINVALVTQVLCINSLLRKHLKQLYCKNSFDNASSMIYLYESSSYTPKTMRKNGRKTVVIEVIGEIKYVRDLALAFIENKSNDGNWFGNFGSKVKALYSKFCLKSVSVCVP